MKIALPTMRSIEMIVNFCCTLIKYEYIEVRISFVSEN